MQCLRRDAAVTPDSDAPKLSFVFLKRIFLATVSANQSWYRGALYVFICLHHLTSVFIGKLTFTIRVFRAARMASFVSDVLKPSVPIVVRPQHCLSGNTRRCLTHKIAVVVVLCSKRIFGQDESARRLDQPQHNYHKVIPNQFDWCSGKMFLH